MNVPKLFLVENIEIRTYNSFGSDYNGAMVFGAQFSFQVTTTLFHIWILHYFNRFMF